MKLESLKSEKFEVLSQNVMNSICGGTKYEYSKPLPPSQWDEDRRPYWKNEEGNIIYGSFMFKCFDESWPYSYEHYSFRQ